MKSMTIIPVVSEKAYAQSAGNVYTFRVPLNLNKNEIQAAVEAHSHSWLGGRSPVGGSGHRHLPSMTPPDGKVPPSSVPRSGARPVASLLQTASTPQPSLHLGTDDNRMWPAAARHLSADERSLYTRQMRVLVIHVTRQRATAFWQNQGPLSGGVLRTVHPAERQWCAVQRIPAPARSIGLSSG